MRTFAIVSVSLIALASTPAAARNGAWYVGGDFGAMIVEDTEFDFGGSNQVTLDHDYGFDGALFVGYDLGAFRLEAETAYKRAGIDELETTFTLPGSVGSVSPGVHPGHGRSSALSFMINGMLDFGDDDGTSGFIGGGAGIARVDYSRVRAFENGSAYIDDSDSRLAWQIFAGVRQALSDNVDLTVRYRFFNVENLRVPDVGGFDGDTRFRSHSLLGGITFNFGEPPPPPPPVAPPPPPPPAPLPPPPPAPPPPPPPAPVDTGPFIVFFDWDSDEITPAAAATLDSAANAYQQSGRASVMIAGHADRSGPLSYNDDLSQRRADNASAYLAGRGVPASAIATEAFGETDNRVPTADGVREAQNRRVEVDFGPGSGW